jgi:hypothetical protein
MDFLRELTPKYAGTELIKFIINIKTQQVAVGMLMHVDGLELVGIDKDSDGVGIVFGGNLYYDNNFVQWSSKLNAFYNMEVYKTDIKSDVNPRILLGKDKIEELEEILRLWISY